jgi:hypothetical protein
MRRARLAVALSLTALLQACSQGAHPERGAVPASPVTQEGVRQALAYEHSLSVLTAEVDVVPASEAVQAACRNAAADLCVLLDSHLDTERSPSASLRLRARAAGIAKLEAALSGHGRVLDRSTSAEDLAAPIQDADKKLALLTDYRTRLEDLRKTAGTNIDSLIRVNHELSEVQGQIEELAGNRARLVQRVDTQILRVAIRSEGSASAWRPVVDAFASFGPNLAGGLGQAVTGVAYLLPWLLVLLPLIWALRWLWGVARRKRHGA